MSLGEGARAPRSQGEDRVRDAVRAIAVDPSENSRPISADQLQKTIYEFDEAYTAYVEGFVELPTEAQMLAIQALDTQVASMVSRKDALLWTAGGHLSDPDWHALRTLAARVIHEFEWRTT